MYHLCHVKFDNPNNIINLHDLGLYNLHIIIENYISPDFLKLFKLRTISSTKCNKVMLPNKYTGFVFFFSVTNCG